MMTMSQRLLFLWLALAMTAAGAAVAQQRQSASVPVDAQISAALKQVSAEHLKATVNKLASFRTRNTLSSPVPRDNEIGAARGWIQAELERYAQACGGCLEVATDRFSEGPAPRLPQATEIVNVYGVLRGSDATSARSIYVVSGHYDSRAGDVLDAHAAAPGANDDGSGVAVVLEAARVLSRYKFPATILFLAVAGEEQGLNGSRHFAKMAKEQNWEIGGVLNDDTVGGDKSPGQDAGIVRVFSEGLPVNASEAEIRLIRATGGENDSPSRQLARYVREVARTYLPGRFGPKMVFRPDRYLRGGDHTSFNEQGFAAVRLTEYRENYNHQHQNPRIEKGIEYGDLPKFVDADYLANVARLNIATLAALASAPAPPVNVKLETKALENDSALSWAPSPDGQAVSYEVLWRPTTSAEWDNVEAVGKVIRATIKRSKDNVNFAVRAVDAKGHRSLPVAPTPER